MLKKSMDILDVYAWINRHREDVKQCIIDNIYRSRHYWFLRLRCRDRDQLLKIMPGQRIHFSTSEPLSRDIDNFAKYLRAHVRGCRILGVDQPWWERIVVLKTSWRDKILAHYVEIVPRGLWIITDQDARILYSSRFEEFKDRVIKQGVSYQPPPQRGIPPWNTSELRTSLAKGRDLVRGVVSEWGLPGYIAEEILHRAGLLSYKNKKPSEISNSDLSQLIVEYQNIAREASEGGGFLIRSESGLELFTAYRPRLFIDIYEYEIKTLGSIDEATDVYFTEYEAKLEEEEKRRELEKEIESWRNRIREQEKLIEEYEKEYEYISKILDLIYTNYSYLSEIHECARRVVKTKSWDSIKECNMEKYNPSTGSLYIKFDGQEVELSIIETLDKQILDLEKRKGEVEKKISRAREVLAELQSNLARSEEEVKIRIHAKPSPRFWYEKFRWSITRNDFIVVAGKDASQNEVLVKKHLRDKDIFLHADIHGAPATILLLDSKEPGIEDIEDAAVIAACYSRAWRAGYSYVDVYWVRGEQVSKTPPSGEYIGKGAFMIYGKREYLRKPLLLGIGLRLFCDEIYGDYVKIYVGSPELVREKTISYVIIAPGELDANTATRIIHSKLVEKALVKTGVKYTIDDQAVTMALPGPLRIIEEGVGNGIDKCPD